MRSIPDGLIVQAIPTNRLPAGFLLMPDYPSYAVNLFGEVYHTRTSRKLAGSRNGTRYVLKKLVRGRYISTSISRQEAKNQYRRAAGIQLIADTGGGTYEAVLVECPDWGEKYHK